MFDSSTCVHCLLHCFCTHLVCQICSSAGCIIWMWWFDIFITHDLYFSLCAHLSEIWHTKVKLHGFSHSPILLLLASSLSHSWKEDFLVCWFPRNNGHFFFFGWTCTQMQFNCIMLHDIFASYWICSVDSFPFFLPIFMQTCRFIKQCGWLLAVIQSLLIIASRKHYTVDVVVAW